MKDSGVKAHYIAVVTGDVTIDWHIVRSDPVKVDTRIWDPDQWTTACCQRGGAALLADLISTVMKQLNQKKDNKYTLYQTGAIRDPVHSNHHHYHHSYALWTEFSSRGKPVWRVQEYLGLDRRTIDNEANWQRVVDDPDEANLVVFDDADLGFRDTPDYWPQILKQKKKSQLPWILLKMTRPVAQGMLWEHLLATYADRMIVVTTVDDLRRSEVQISQGLSWERTAQDVVWELIHNPRVNGMSRCFAAVVSFNTEGAVVISNQDNDPPAKMVSVRPKARLVFDPLCVEGMWQQEHPGGMIGYTTCLVAGIIRELLQFQNNVNIDSGIRSGIAAMRNLHREGYRKNDTEFGKGISFPLERIADVLSESEPQFAVVNIQDPVRFLEQPENKERHEMSVGWWTILQDRYRDNLVQVARRIVIEGPDAALADVPQGRFGYLLTVDRREIEGFRSIHSLMSEYLRQRQRKRPLSISVFGAPGSGKSFGITQVAQSLSPKEIKVLEFNLSQFESPNELTTAFHMVRDVALGGNIPLVFWDEFDTSLNGQHLGWLRYFLSPMQDGIFREGQITHPIGAAIFVFAGGTCYNIESFGEGLTAEVYRASKIPDFISRLKGYVNILGPNRQPASTDNPERGDPYNIIRRAILLRSLLQRNAPVIFENREGIKQMNIDQGVMRAFLEVSKFKHGIRSMESIIAMSQLAGKKIFARSSLPAEAQLNLHVDGQEFLALVQTVELEGYLLEKLAEINHKMFCEELKAKKYKPGPFTDEKHKLHSSLRPFNELPQDEKEQNRNAVRDIPSKLACIGYVMIPARSNEPPFEFPEDEGDLEKLAELEHERWMHFKQESGWRYGKKTDKAKKVHEAMVPWKKLTVIQKEKDRALVRYIPKILAGAGYTVVKLRTEGKEI